MLDDERAESLLLHSDSLILRTPMSMGHCTAVKRHLGERPVDTGYRIWRRRFTVCRGSEPRIASVPMLMTVPRNSGLPHAPEARMFAPYRLKVEIGFLTPLLV